MRAWHRFNSIIRKPLLLQRLLFVGEPRQAIRYRLPRSNNSLWALSTGRYYPLGIVPAAVKLQFVEQFLSLPLEGKVAER